METKYDAFISYRHVPEDIKIAKEIQHQLEHMHIPGNLAKQIGKKKIGRIFRDKEELPITSDIAQDIQEALRNSEFLIVICSVHTSESQWVQREIASFLETHDKNRVLTVLVNGEPYDVIPPVLTEGMEPLSCDYRGSIRRARREELPRLAAAVLKCKYDDLVQRQRQYQMKKYIAAAGSVFLVMCTILAYYAWSNARIRESYLQTLKNQSRTLALQSMQKLNEGDRMLAIQLALAALPDEGRDRPLVAEAEAALASAVNAYIPEDSTNMEAAYRFEALGAVQFLAVDEDGDSHYFAYTDDEDKVYIWDTDGFVQTAELDLSDSEDRWRIRDLMMTGSMIYVLCTDSVYCVDCETGNITWRYETDDYQQMTGEIVCSNHKGELIVSSYDGIYILNERTGELLEKIENHAPVEHLPFELYETAGAEVEQVISSLSGDLFFYSEYTEDGYNVQVYDRTSGRKRQLLESIYSVRDFAYDENGCLLVLGNRAEQENSYDMYLTGYTTNYHMVSSQSEVLAIDIDSGLVKWEHTIPYWVSGEEWLLCTDQMLDASENTYSSVIVGCGNMLDILDMEDGVRRHHFEMPGGVLGNVYGSYTSDGLSKLQLGLKSGEWVLIDLLEGTMNAQVMFEHNIQEILCQNNRRFVWKMADEKDASELDVLICYDYNQYDKDWHELGQEELSMFDSLVPTEDGILVCNALEDQEIPTEEEDVIWPEHISYEHYIPVSVKIMEDMILVVGDTGVGTNLYRYQAQDGTLLGVTKLLSEASEADRVEFFFPDEDHLVLQIDQNVVMIRTEEWIVTATANGMYSIYEDVIYMKSGGYYGKLGYFPRYSLEELCQKAKEILKNETLDQETKSLYGME
ncbi:MAG: TIR domain-containing protein [Lachnospiraceae bacterium]|nr:TIR domain-containing protein [Lachnospiraceae bacterium]